MEIQFFSLSEVTDSYKILIKSMCFLLTSSSSFISLLAKENFPEADRQMVLEVIASPGFYEVLEPLPGAVEAWEMAMAGS